MRAVHALPQPFPLIRAQRIRRADPSYPRYVELPVPMAGCDDELDDARDGAHVDSYIGPHTMSPAIAVRDHDLLDEVSVRLIESRAAAVAVVDAAGALLGVITRTDLLRGLAVGDRRATAADAMSRFVLVLPLGVPIERAAALMAYEAVGQIVITDAHGDVVGMLTALDVARHCARTAGYFVES